MHSSNEVVAGRRQSASVDSAVEQARREVVAALESASGAPAQPRAALSHALHIIEDARDLGPEAQLALTDLAFELYPDLTGAAADDQAGRELAREIATLHDSTHVEAGASVAASDDGFARDVDDALTALARLVGLAAPETAADRLDYIFDAQPARADHAASLLDGFSRDLGLTPGEVTVRLDDEAAAVTHAHGARGLYDDDVIYLDPVDFGRDSSEAAALLAHELVHAAQARLDPVAADLGAAEHEAYGLMEDARAGRRLAAPVEALPAQTVAACGPQGQKEQERKRRDPEPHPDPEPDQPSDTGGGGGDTPTPTPDKKDDEKKNDDPTGSGGGAGDAEACLDACPDAEEGLTKPKVRTPAPAAPGDGKIVKLNLAGHVIRIRLPKTAKPGQVTVRFRRADSPFEALRLDTAVLQLDESYAVTGGAVRCAVKLGKYVDAPSVSLAVKRGGAVAVRIRGAKVAIGSQIKGTVDLDVNHRGISGEASFTAGQIKLGDSLVLKDGAMRVKVEPGGEVHAHGRLTVEVPGLGEATLDACYVKGEFKGKLTLTLTKQLPVAPGVVVEEITLSGCYRKGAWSIGGSATVNVLERFGATISATYFHTAGSGTWEVEGQVDQRQPVTLGELELFDGHARVAWRRDHFEPGEAHFGFQWRQLAGTVDGVWDIEANELSARGEAFLEEPIVLGDTGARLDQATLTATIERNVPMAVEGDATVLLPYRGADTFQVDAHALWRVQEDSVDATGTVTVLRDVSFGDEGGLHAVVLGQSQGGFRMVDGAITHLGGDIGFRVSHGEHEVGLGLVTFTGGSATALDGDARFALTQRTGIPDVTTGPLILLPGGELALTIAASQLTNAEVVDVTWEMLHPAGTGKLTGSVAGSYDFGTGAAELSGDAQVVEPWLLAEGEWGRLDLLPGGQGEVGYSGSRVTKLGGTLPFHLQVNPVGPVSGFALDGQVAAEVNPESWTVTGGFEGQLQSDLEVTVPGASGDVLKIAQGGTFSGQVADSAPQACQVAATLGYYRGGSGLFLEGQVADASYDVATGQVGFDASLVLKQAIDVPLSGAWRLAVEPEVTTLAVKVVNNAIESVAGELMVTVRDAEGPLLYGALSNGVYDLTSVDPELSGALTLALARTVAVPKAEGLPAPVSMEARAGSAVTATLVSNTLSEVGIDLTIDVGLSGQQVGVATLAGSWDVEGDAVTGSGLLLLTDDVVLGEEGGENGPAGWGLAFLRGSSVAVSVAAGELVPASVDVRVGLRHDGADVARGAVIGQYCFGDEAGFTGDAELHMVSDFELGPAGRFTMLLGQDTRATGRVEASRLTTATGTFVLLAREGGVDKVALGLDTTYTGGAFDGVAELRVLDPLRLGERALGIHAYAIDLAVGSGGQVQITQNAPTSASGDVILDVAMDETPFARGTFVVPPIDLTRKDASINAQGSLELFQSVELGAAGDYTFFLDGGTGIVGSVTDNALDWLEGQLVLGLATATEGRVAVASLAGRYEGGEAPRFDGQAALVVTRGFSLGYEAFGYGFGLAPSSFVAVMEQGQITAASGSLDVLATQRAGDEEAPLGTITVHLSGAYARALGEATGHFSGTGTCDVSGELRVGEAGEYALFVLGGSGVEIDVEDNRFTRLHGGLVARVDQLAPKSGETTELLELRTDVTYVPKDGGRVDADGAVALIGRKELLSLDGYSFWLVEDRGGSGATVRIVDNQVIEVGGRVSCAVYDGHPTPLIEAHADGTWVRATNSFSGAGDIRTGRDLTFPEEGASGPKIMLLAGSGGGGVVTDNRIDSLSGRLECVIYDGDRPLVHAVAEGEYDAVNDTIVRAIGDAELIEPLYLGGTSESDALLVIRALGGMATIENSALVAVHGDMSFELPRLGLAGAFNGDWTNVNGVDEYWGDGHIAFDLFADDDEGRGLRGDIAVAFNRDGTWLVDGALAYALTPYLKTTAHLTMDEGLDPVIDAGFDVDNVTLLDAHDIFSTNFDLFRLSSGFVYGGVSAGVGLSTKAMKLETDFLVKDWHPMPPSGVAQEVPDFHAALKLTWGAELTAELAAWIALGLDVLIGRIGGGVRGAVGLEVPADVSVTGTLDGGQDGLRGAIELGLALSAFVTLTAGPFVEASLLWWDWRKSWEVVERLGPVFELSWGQRVTFGDVEEAPTPIAGPAAAPRSGGYALSSETPLGQEPERRPEVAPSAPQARPGGPQIAPTLDPREGAPEQQSGLPGALGRDMKRYEPIMNAMAELQALIEIASPIIDKLRDNLFRAIVDLARGVPPGWEQLVDQAKKVYAAAQAVWEEFRGEVEDFQTRRILDDLLGPKPDLLDALFGADDAVRREVKKGTHRDPALGPVERADFVNTMLVGVCGDEDEDAILEILRFSAAKGELATLISHVKMGVDGLLWKLDGRQDDELREILDEANIRY